MANDRWRARGNAAIRLLERRRKHLRKRSISIFIDMKSIKNNYKRFNEALRKAAKSSLALTIKLNSMGGFVDER